MFGNSSSLLGGLTLSKVLGGASRTIGFVNQAIPLYYQVRPLLSNAKTVVNMYSSMKNNTTNNNSPPNNIKEIPESIEKKEVNNDTLTFFQ